MDSASNFMRFALIQVEEGIEATDFERRSFAEELLLCQRYYGTGDYHQTLPISNALVTASYLMWVAYPTTMRVNPAITGASTVGSFTSTRIRDDGAAMGRSDTVANRPEAGTWTADAEL